MQELNYDDYIRIFKCYTVLDFFQKRSFHEEAAQILELCKKRKIKGYVCAHEITTLSYFLFKDQKDTEKVKFAINKLLDILTIIPTTETILRDSLNSNISDFEDAVIEISANKNEIDCIITRNIKDFQKSKISILLPSEYLVLYNKL